MIAIYLNDDRLYKIIKRGSSKKLNLKNNQFNFYIQITQCNSIPIPFNKWLCCDHLHLSPIYNHKIIQIRCLVLEDSLPLSSFVIPLFGIWIAGQKSTQILKRRVCFRVTGFDLMTYICNIWVDKAADGRSGMGY